MQSAVTDLVNTMDRKHLRSSRVCDTVWIVRRIISGTQAVGHDNRLINSRSWVVVRVRRRESHSGVLKDGVLLHCHQHFTVFSDKDGLSDHYGSTCYDRTPSISFMDGY